VYTYSRSQGLFAGISLEGTVIGTRRVEVVIEGGQGCSSGNPPEIKLASKHLAIFRVGSRPRALAHATVFSSMAVTRCIRILPRACNLMVRMSIRKSSTPGGSAARMGHG